MILKKVLVSSALTSTLIVQLPLFGQNTLIGGDVTDGANWDTGSPTAIGNIGIIDLNNVGANEALLPATVSSLFISQTGGDVAAGPGFVLTSTLNNTQYDISGGNIGINSLTLTNGSLFTVSGGTVGIGSLPGNPRNVSLNTLATLTITDGLLNIAGGLAVNSGTAANKIINFSGGTSNIEGGMFTGFQPSGTANFLNDAILSVTGTIGANQAGSRLFNIGLGTGSISAGTLEARNAIIDWSASSEFSFTATTIVSSGAAVTWQDLWTAGNLTYEGSNVGNFGDYFVVDGANTLTLVPEPSTYAMIFGAFALGLVALRRRK